MHLMSCLSSSALSLTVIESITADDCWPFLDGKDPVISSLGIQPLKPLQSCNFWFYDALMKTALMSQKAEIPPSMLVAFGFEPSTARSRVHAFFHFRPLCSPQRDD